MYKRDGLSLSVDFTAKNESSTKKAIHIALITTIGLTQNEFYDDVQNIVEMSQLFQF